MSEDPIRRPLLTVAIRDYGSTVELHYRTPSGERRGLDIEATDTPAVVAAKLRAVADDITGRSGIPPRVDPPVSRMERNGRPT